MQGQTPHDRAADREAIGFRFRLVHLLYVIAVVASSLATLGIGGIVPAVVVVSFWTVVFCSRSRPKAFRIALVALLLLGCLIPCLLLPMVNTAREAARRVQCHLQLKSICLGLQNYHDTYGSFPPAYVADEDGTPMHSWRVLILPFMECRSLYDQYNFGEPWDGPNNSKLLSSMPYFYGCPTEVGREAADKFVTSYVAVVDPRTAWPGPSGRTYQQIEAADGTAGTIMVVEAVGLGTPWMKPEDPGLAGAIRCLSSTDMEAARSHRWEDFFYSYSAGSNVAMVDGSVHFLDGGSSPDLIRKRLLIDDGSGVDEIPPRSNLKQNRKPKLDNWFRLALLILIAVFPTPWVWLNPTSGRATDEPNRAGSAQTNEAKVQ